MSLTAFGFDRAMLHGDEDNRPRKSEWCFSDLFSRKKRIEVLGSRRACTHLHRCQRVRGAALVRVNPNRTQLLPCLGLPIQLRTA